MHSVRLTSKPLVWIGGVLLALAAAWSVMRPAEAQNAAPAVEGEFVLSYAELFTEDLCETIVYNSATGQAWRRTGTAWKEIEEPAPLARGKYQVTVVPSHQGGFRTFRLDQLTGQTWYITDLKWAAFEPLEK